MNGSKSQGGKSNSSKNKKSKQKIQSKQIKMEQQREISWNPVIMYVLGTLFGIGLTAISIFFYDNRTLTLWITFATFVVFLITIYILLRDHVWRNHLSKLNTTKYIIGFIVLIVFFVCVAFSSLYPSKPFSIHIENVIGQEKREMNAWFWFTYRSSYGDTASPLHRAIVIRLTNLQPIPTMIESMKVEILSKERKWVKLTHVDIRTGDVTWAYNDFLRARRFDMTQDGLDYLIGNKQIQPHKTVRGWAFFELPQDLILNSPVRVTVRDVLGNEASQITYPPVCESCNTHDFMVKSRLVIKAGEWDISDYYKKYYSEPIE